MRYGRDYGNQHHGGNRNWLDRAGEAVNRWFGNEGGHYDRDYGYRRDGGSIGGGMMGGGYGGGQMGGARDWHRVGMHGGEDRVRYVNRGYDRDMGGYGYTGGGGYRGGSMDYGREYRGGNAGYGSGRGFGNGGYGGYGYGTPQRDLDDDMDRGGRMDRGGMDRGGYMGGNRGSADTGDFGRGSGGWGDYINSPFRGSNSGGVSPGQYFTGYGHGGRQSYGPGW